MTDMVWKAFTQPYLTGKYMTRGKHGVEVIQHEYGDWRVYETTNGHIYMSEEPTPRFSFEREALTYAHNLLKGKSI